MIKKEFNSNGTGDTVTESPVDNNMSNQIVDNNNGNNTSTKEEQKTNYDSGKSETKTISAQGKVLRVTASVMIDRILTDDEVDQLTQSVSNAIGLNPVNGDQLTVTGMPFDINMFNNECHLVDKEVLMVSMIYEGYKQREIVKQLKLDMATYELLLKNIREKIENNYLRNSIKI